MRHFLLTFSVVYAAIVCLPGCNKTAGPETVGVSGIVTFDGASVEGAVVVFTPSVQTDVSQQAAQGETDADGKFDIQTYVAATSDYRTGVAPGEYRVTVTKLQLPADMRGTPKHVLPKQYREVATTPLSVTVESGDDQQFDFDLQKR